MQRFWQYASFWAATTLVGLLLSIAVICHHYRVYSLGGWQAYRAMAAECHPVWREYNFCSIKAGDSVEEVIAKTNPRSVKRTSKWAILSYQEPGNFSHVSAYAYDDPWCSHARGVVLGPMCSSTK